jgi:hypothetical protein
MRNGRKLQERIYLSEPFLRNLSQNMTHLIRFRNQKRLGPALITALQGLAQGGMLGDLEILFFCAHRDQTGRVVSSL